MGEGVWRWGKREIIYLLQHCHRQNDFCIKVGSDHSHFNVSLIVRDKVTRQASTDHKFLRERTTEADSNRGPSAYQPNALPQGQTGSPAFPPTQSSLFRPSSSLYQPTHYQSPRSPHPCLPPLFTSYSLLPGDLFSVTGSIVTITGRCQLARHV